MKDRGMKLGGGPKPSGKAKLKGDAFSGGSKGPIGKASMAGGKKAC